MTKRLITAKMLIGEIVEKYPRAAEELVAKYGLHCVGCYGAMGETLEEGLMIHEISKKKMAKVVEELNGLVSKKG